MHRVFFGVVLLALTSANAEAGKRPWEDQDTTTTIKVDVIDPNALAEEEKQRALDKAFIQIDLDAFSDTAVPLADKPDPALLVALRGAPPCPSEREPDKVYLSAPAAPKQ
jgi:hypothetical protein